VEITSSFEGMPIWLPLLQSTLKLYSSPKKIILWETPQTLQKYILIPTTSQTAL
jgi:hypothetical protein